MCQEVGEILEVAVRQIPELYGHRPGVSDAGADFVLTHRLEQMVLALVREARHLLASAGSAGGSGGGSFEMESANERRSSLVSPLAAAVIAGSFRRPSRNRKSWATTKNWGWPPRDGVPGTRDWPPGPWQARHTVSRSSMDAANPGDARVKRPNAARTAMRVEGGRATLDPDLQLNASS